MLRALYKTAACFNSGDHYMCVFITTILVRKQTDVTVKSIVAKATTAVDESGKTWQLLINAWLLR